jgi:hypothetical protein
MTLKLKDDKTFNSWNRGLIATWTSCILDGKFHANHSKAIEIKKIHVCYLEGAFMEIDTEKIFVQSVKKSR